MKNETSLLIELFNSTGHSLKNIETVFKEAVEELTQAENDYLNIVGRDSEIALNKLSKISTAFSRIAIDYEGKNNSDKEEMLHAQINEILSMLTSST